MALLMLWEANTHMLTSYNGKEFANHAQIAEALKAAFYFAYPYSLWEEDTNENANGLIRQQFPKKRDLEAVSGDEIEFVRCNLDNRPKKHLPIYTFRGILILLHLRVNPQHESNK